MYGQYFHSECRGCVSFGTECDTDCEYSDNPEPCKYFKQYVPETPDYEEDYTPDEDEIPEFDDSVDESNYDPYAGQDVFERDDIDYEGE